MAFIEAEDYRFFYPEQTEPALDVSHFSVEKGSFVLLTGPSGSGKTTLLRQLAKETMLQGRTVGNLECQAERCAYVWQNPDSQIVTDRVEYEIVFGLENMGMQKEQMQRRLAEVVTFFGLEELAGRDTMNLSGGEMQTVNVAAGVAGNPDLLLLDEPTSQLDPVAARKLYELLRQINEELGVTIVLAEQRLEDVVLLADQMGVMCEGKMIAQGTPAQVYDRVSQSEAICYFPSYMRLYHEWSGTGQCPLSMKEVRQWFEAEFIVRTPDESSEKKEEQTENTDTILCRNLFFRYEKNLPDVLNECSCEFSKGRITCLAGGNGSGKTTLLEVLAGRYRPYHGRIKNRPEKCSVLPQQPSYLFLKDTVEKECRNAPERTQELLRRFGMACLMKRNPADLSGGEMERLGLSLVLGQEADMYLLDEPSKGLDFQAKNILGEVLQEMKREGKTILVMSRKSG